MSTNFRQDRKLVPRTSAAELSLLDKLVSHPEGLTPREIGQGRTRVFKIARDWGKHGTVDLIFRKSDRPGRPSLLIKPNEKTFEEWRKRRQVEGKNISFFLDLEASDYPPLSSLDLEGIDLNANIADEFTERMLRFLGNLSIRLVEESAFSSPQSRINITIRTRQTSKEIAGAARKLQEINTSIHETYVGWSRAGNDEVRRLEDELLRWGPTYESVDVNIWEFFTTVARRPIFLYLGREKPFHVFSASLARYLYTDSRELLRQICTGHEHEARQIVVTELKKTVYKPLMEEFEQDFVQNKAVKNWIQRHLDGKEEWYSWVPFEYFGFERTYKHPMLAQRGEVAFALSHVDYASCLRTLQEALNFENPLWHTSELSANDLAWLQAWQTMRSRWTNVVKGNVLIETRIRATLRSKSKRGWRGHPDSNEPVTGDRQVTDPELKLTNLLLKYLETYYKTIKEQKGEPDGTNAIFFFNLFSSQPGTNVWSISELLETIDVTIRTFDRADGAIDCCIQEVEELLSAMKRPGSQPLNETEQMEERSVIRPQRQIPSDQQLEQIVTMLEATAFVWNEVAQNTTVRDDRFDRRTATRTTK